MVLGMEPVQIKVGTSGDVALVNAADAARVRKYRWQLHKSDGPLRYARAEFWVNRKRLRLSMHRLVMDARPGQVLDHIDGNGLNNQRANLRFCTHAENLRNRRKRLASEQNPYKGVYLRQKGWLCIIRDPTLKQQMVIGVFDDPVTAAKAYDEVAARLFGEFASLNFPAAAG
jgi:hypothetical protein